MIISISGNDGSGKSTTIIDLKNWIKTYSDLEVEVREEFNYFLLKYLMKFFGKGNTKNLRKKYLDEDKSNKDIVIGRIWAILVCIDLFIEYIYLILIGIYKNKIFILDRSLFDFYISWEYLGANTQITKLFINHFPAYDISFVLFVDPRIAYRRKKASHSYPISFYELQTKRYLDLKKLNKKLIYIDTSVNFDKTSIDIKREILFKYFKSNDINSKNIKLFQFFVNQYLPYELAAQQKRLGIKNLTKEQFNVFPRGSKIKIIKKFDVPSDIGRDNEEDDIDVYQPFKVDFLKSRLEKKKLIYSVEPGRLSFDLGKIEMDVHTALSFWNVDFILPTNSEKKSDSLYLQEGNELLVYVAHSVYKHGLIEKGDLLSVIKLMNNKEVDLKKCLNYASAIKWENGFLFFIETLKLSILDNRLVEKKVALHRYFYFWLVQYLKNDKASFSSIIIGHYAYLRSNNNSINFIFSILKENSLFKKISSGFGFRYAK